MNFSALVRQYISDHPGVTYSDVAGAFNREPLLVNKLCAKMAKRGLLVADRSASPAKYSIGRKPILDRTLTPEESAELRDVLPGGTNILQL